MSEVPLQRTPRMSPLAYLVSATEAVGLCYQLGGAIISVLSAAISPPADNYRCLRGSGRNAPRGAQRAHRGEYLCSMKITTHLDHIGHCKTASGTNWSNRWTYRALAIYILTEIKPQNRRTGGTDARGSGSESETSTRRALGFWVWVRG